MTHRGGIRKAAAAAAAGVGFLIAGGAAFAEVPTQEVEELLRSAQDDFDSRFYAQAAGKLEAAFALEPEPEYLLRLVEVYDRWGEHCDDVFATFERFFEVCPACEQRTLADKRARELDERCQAPVVFRTNPPGARIRVDGREAGVTPMEMKLPAGRHTFALALRGYSEHQAVLDLKAGVEELVDVDMLRASGDVAELVIVNVPRHTEVIVDGRAVERAGEENIFVDPGQHQLQARHVGGQVALLNLIVERGDRVEVDVGRALGPVKEVRDDQLPGRSSPAPALPVGHIGLAVGGAAVAMGVLFGTLAGAAERDRDLAVASAAWPGAPPKRDEILDHDEEAKRNALLSNVAFGVGAAAAVTGLVLIFVPDGAIGAASGLSPVVAPGMTGVCGAF